MIDTGPEWRAFSSDQALNRIRTGASTTLTIHDKGLSTIIGWKNKDAYGKNLTPEMKDNIYRLRKWHDRTRTIKSVDRNLSFAMTDLDRIGSQLILSKELRESAAYIYRKMAQKNLIRGRSIEAMLIASIYVACKMNGIPKTLNDFIKFTTTEKKKIARCYRLIKEELDITVQGINPTSFIPRFRTQLMLSGKTENRAMKLLERIKNHSIIIGKSPIGVASAALYIAAIQEGERRTQKEVSMATGMTEATIRNRYKEIANHFNFDIHF